jgi:hypothetical protein
MEPEFAQGECTSVFGCRAYEVQQEFRGHRGAPRRPMVATIPLTDKPQLRISQTKISVMQLDAEMAKSWGVACFRRLPPLALTIG